MTNGSAFALTRRAVLAGTTATVASAFLTSPRAGAANPSSIRNFKLHCAPGHAPITSAQSRDTSVWCYNGQIPGPEIRVKQGERIRVTVENDLSQDTTVHWHGVRLPNAMDGVPQLTQKPIAPGEHFVYEFDAVDAGTFWYHPHQRSSEQVGRGLSGPLIIEERSPIRVDREVTWVLDDWRLTQSHQINDDFENMGDMSHGGRLGNLVTINGGTPSVFGVRAGERVRLRLVNTANARIFGLEFTDHEPVIISIDGQPVTPHEPADGLLVLGPGMRMDIVIDMVQKPGSAATVIDRFYERYAYKLIGLAYSDNALRDHPPQWPMDLPNNPLPEPDLKGATRHQVVFNGGMMGGMIAREMGSMISAQKMSEEMQSGKLWFINGMAAKTPATEPLLTLAKGQSHVLMMSNATAFDHPIHLHGHSVRVVSRNGKPTQHQEWQDTVMVAPRERVEVAVVADNPGDWMFHCHILEHQAAGMMGVIRVL